MFWKIIIPLIATIDIVLDVIKWAFGRYVGYSPAVSILLVIAGSLVLVVIFGYVDSLHCKNCKR